MDVRLTVVIIAQYVHLKNRYIVPLKCMQCHMSTNLNKMRENSATISSTA